MDLLNGQGPDVLHQVGIQTSEKKAGGTGLFYLLSRGPERVIREPGTKVVVLSQRLTPVAGQG